MSFSVMPAYRFASRCCCSISSKVSDIPNHISYPPYDHSSDSTVDIAQWRVILNMLPSEQRSHAACPRFDEMKHAGVCAEVCFCIYFIRAFNLIISQLKFLYVAITRYESSLLLHSTLPDCDLEHGRTFGSLTALTRANLYGSVHQFVCVLRTR
jgi:hypothetical protein